MDEGIGQQILTIGALIVANGFFSMTEMSIVSVRRARLEAKAEEGDEGAIAALSLSENPTQLLSAVQIGITLISIITGLYGGATLSAPMAQFLSTYVPVLAPYAESMSPLIIVALITYLSLVVGELVPKQIALTTPEAIAMRVARPMSLFASIASPFVSTLTFSTQTILRILGIQERAEEPVTEDEIKVMLHQGAALGVYEEDEPELVDNVFRLADYNVADVMTPRTQIEWIDLDEEDAMMRERIMRSTHFRLPVGRDSLDVFEGIVHLSDVFTHFLAHPDQSVRAHVEACIVSHPVVVPETITLMKLLRRFREEGSHEAIVLDEFGGVSGIVTLHDVMEELIGLMPSTQEERMEEENRILVRDAHSWYIDGLLPIGDWHTYFEWEPALPDEEADLYKTMGGFFTYMMGRIPKEGDRVVVGPFSFEVCDMDRARVDKMIMTRVEEEVDGTDA